MSAWLYRMRNGSTPNGPFDYCEECGGAIRERDAIERVLHDGQRVFVEVIHQDCGTGMERRLAELSNRIEEESDES